MPPRIGKAFDSGIIERLKATGRGFWASLEKRASEIFDDNWMPPGNPPPVDIEVIDFRRLDYSPYQNINNYQPTGREGVTDLQLRNLAETCEVLRGVIQNCKNQLSTQKFTFQLRNLESMTPDEAKSNTENSENIKRCKAFFKKPDGRRSFALWVRMLMEELLVLDKICILKQRNILSGPLWARLIDGNTIVKKIDRSGETPLPPYIAYQQVLKGVVTGNLTMDQMLVYHRNPRTFTDRGFGPVEQILQIVNIALKRSQFQLSYYTEGNIPDMLISVAAQWNDAQVAKYQKYFDLLLAGDLAQRRKIRFLPEAAQVIEPQKDVLKDEFDEWLARVICYVFGVTPNGFIKNLNRAIGESQREQSDEEGKFEREQTVKEVVDILIEDYLGIDDVEFVWLPNKSQDSFKQAQIDQILAETGIYSIDEIRKSRGLHPIGVGNMVKTAHGYVALVKGEDDHIEEAKTTITQKDGDPPKPVEQ